MTENKAIEQIALTNQRLSNVINEFEFIARSRVIYNNTQLVNYINLLYQRAHHNYLRGMFHASPGLWAILLAIWGVIKIIYEAVVFLIDLLKIKEILQIAEILRIVWPKFRVKYNEILGKISEFSKQIGWGADGLIHLIQAAQGGMNLLKGVTGKSFEWLQIAGAEKALRALAVVSMKSDQIAKDPSSVLDLAFNIPYEETSREIGRWWDNAIDWLTKTTKTAEEAVKKVNDTIDNLLELENNMPAFVRDNIPSWVSDGITWVDTQIDNTILPRLTELANEFTQINAQLEAERVRAADLAEQLSRPGDLLERVEMLHESEREDQQRKMDDAVSAEFARDTESKKQQNVGIIAKLQAITDALREAPPALVFLELEGIKRSIIKTPAGNIYGSWNIDDFVTPT